MAIAKYSPSSVTEYLGLTTDTKPTGNDQGPGPKVGDRFVETDATGKVWVWNGSAWVSPPGAIFTAGA